MIRTKVDEQTYIPMREYISGDGKVRVSLEDMEDARALGKDWKSGLTSKQLKIINDAEENQKNLDISNKPRNAYKDAIDLKEVIGTYDLHWVNFVDSTDGCRTRALGLTIPESKFVTQYEGGNVISDIISEIKKEYNDYIKHNVSNEAPIEVLKNVKMDIYDVSFFTRSIAHTNDEPDVDVKIRYKWTTP